MRPMIVDLVSRFARALPVDGRIAEYGSRQLEQDTHADLRPLFSRSSYVGIDIEPGPGVDLVKDVTDPALVQPDAYNVALCIDMLEHCFEPAQAIKHIAEETTRWALLTTVMFFPIHSCPDLWRFTPEGLHYLMKGHFKWLMVFTAGVDLNCPHTVAGLGFRHEPNVDDWRSAIDIIKSWQTRWNEDIANRRKGLKRSWEIFKAMKAGAGW